MRRVLVVIVTAISGSVGLADSSTAQSLPLRPVPSVTELTSTIPPSAQQMAGIEQWTRDYKAWRVWFAEWRNRPQPSTFGTHARRPRPEPPDALYLACPAPTGESGALADACRLLDEWRNDDVATEIIKQQMATARAQKETEDRSVWWRHLHLDALWPMTQGTSGIYGVLGLHSTIDLTGRIELFLAPGAFLMRVPGPAGPEWKPATDWGLSYRVSDFTMPGARRPVTLHLNVARVWLFGQREDVPAAQSDMYLAGFSLTFRKVVTH